MADPYARDTPSARPKYKVGQSVRYRDREDRVQTGHVKWIEAKWHGWGCGPVAPLVIYALWHPTYHRKNFYGTDKNIMRPLTERELEGYRYE